MIVICISGLLKRVHSFYLYYLKHFSALFLIYKNVFAKVSPNTANVMSQISLIYFTTLKTKTESTKNQYPLSK